MKPAPLSMLIEFAFGDNELQADRPIVDVRNTVANTQNPGRGSISHFN